MNPALYAVGALVVIAALIAYFIRPKSKKDSMLHVTMPDKESRK